MESGGYCLCDYANKTNRVIAEAYQLEARAFLSSMNLSMPKFIAMNKNNSNLVCNILLCASILNNVKLFRRIMEAWEHPLECFSAGYGDYYSLSETSVQKNGLRKCKFRLWTHGGGAIATCIIQHDAAEREWEYFKY